MMVVKLGGSVITDKAVHGKARPQTIRRLASELAPFHEDVILVHGAGSFGHIKADEYGLKDGVSGRKALLGAAEVQAEVRALDAMVVAALHKERVPAVSVPPSLFLSFSGGSLDDYEADIFAETIARGFLPVTFGDVVLDSQQGVAICSGDDLMKLLASELKADKAVFVTDVDGIFDADPKKSKHAKLLREIDPLRPQVADTSGGAKKDVTGAMAGKLETALDIAALGVDVYVVNGNEPGRLKAALGGRKGIWTRIGGMR